MEERLPRRLPDRRRGQRVLGLHPAVDLAGRSAAEVVAAPEVGLPRGEGIGARRERLRLQGLDLGEQIGGQLARHDAEEVLLEVGSVDHGHSVAAAKHGQGTAVRIPLPFDEPALGGLGDQGRPGGEPDGRTAERADHQSLAHRSRNPENPGLGVTGNPQGLGFGFGRRTRREDREVTTGLRITPNPDFGPIRPFFPETLGDFTGAGLAREGAEREDRRPGLRLGRDERFRGLDHEFSGAQRERGRRRNPGRRNAVGETDPDLAGGLGGGGVWEESEEESGGQHRADAAEREADATHPARGSRMPSRLGSVRGSHACGGRCGPEGPRPFLTVGTPSPPVQRPLNPVSRRGRRAVRCTKRPA